MKTLSSLKNFTTLTKTQQKTISGGYIGPNCSEGCDPPKIFDNSDFANE